MQMGPADGFLTEVHAVGRPGCGRPLSVPLAVARAARNFLPETGRPGGLIRATGVGVDAIGLPTWDPEGPFEFH